MNDPSTGAFFGFEDEASMWQAGYELILELRRLRGIAVPPIPPRHDEAQHAIRVFCDRLRDTDCGLSMPRLKHEAHLTDAGLVAVVHVLASHWVGIIPPYMNQVAVVAHGFSPVALQAFADKIRRKSGIGKLVEVIDGYLHPSPTLLQMLRPCLGEIELVELRQQLKALPLAPEDRSDIPDNRVGGVDEPHGD